MDFRRLDTNNNNNLICPIRGSATQKPRYRDPINVMNRTRSVCSYLPTLGGRVRRRGAEEVDRLFLLLDVNTWYFNSSMSGSRRKSLIIDLIGQKVTVLRYLLGKQEAVSISRRIRGKRWGPEEKRSFAQASRCCFSHAGHKGSLGHLLRPFLRRSIFSRDQCPHLLAKERNGHPCSS